MRFIIALLVPCVLIATPQPIQFSIPACKVVKQIPKKDRDFAFIIPGKIETYIYTEERDYYADYQRSYFAVTCKKGGWDCMRHYEILANGSIPYFLDLDACDEQTMPFLPKALIKEAMNLPGVSYLHIDHEKFDELQYYTLLAKILDHTRKHLTTHPMAQYLLDSLHYKGTGKILYLSNRTDPDYLRDCTLIGLKQIHGARIVDYPRIDFIYTNYEEDCSQLYGRGFSYSKTVKEEPVDRSRIVERIAAGEFDLIIYGSAHRGMLFQGIAQLCYPQERIAYLCGEDVHSCGCAQWDNMFLREAACAVEVSEPYHVAYSSDPDPALHTFCLAEAYRDAGERGKAIEYYQKRLAMGGAKDELFWSTFQIAAQLHGLDVPPHVYLKAYEEACAYDPSRVEPAYYIAQYYNSQGQHQKAYDTIHRWQAARTNDHHTYSYWWVEDYAMLVELSLCAYYVGQYQESFDVCNTLLTITSIPYTWRGQVEANKQCAQQMVDKRPFVTCRLYGQFGNQLFQTATALAYAWDHNLRPVFPELYRSVSNTSYNREKALFRLDASPLPRSIALTCYERDGIPRNAINDICLDGYFESYANFHRHRDRLRALYAPSDGVVKYLKHKYANLLAHPNTVSIHVRTYDEDNHMNFKPFVGLEYYKKAMALFPDDAIFCVFSDRINWCKQHFQGFGRNIVFIEGNDHIQDFFLMSMLQHHIIANSTFSWWAAYLDSKSTATVVLPDHWYSNDSSPNPNYRLPGWLIAANDPKVPYPTDIRQYDRHSQSIDNQ